MKLKLIKRYKVRHIPQALSILMNRKNLDGQKEKQRHIFTSTYIVALKQKKLIPVVIIALWIGEFFKARFYFLRFPSGFPFTILVHYFSISAAYPCEERGRVEWTME
jgi:hypothetical protein